MWSFTSDSLDQPWQGNIPDWSAEEPDPDSFRLPSPMEDSTLPSSLTSCSASELDALFMASLLTAEQSQQPLPDFPNDFTSSDDTIDFLNGLLSQKLASNTAASRPVEDGDAAALVAPAPSLCGSDSDTSSSCGSVESGRSPKSTTPASRTSRTSPECAGPRRAVHDASKVSKRIPHHEVERRYRNGLNKQLERLRDVIPSTRDVDAAGTYGKLSKTVILTSAIDYIASLEAQIKLIGKEKEVLYGILRIGDIRQTKPRIDVVEKSSCNWAL